VPQLLMSTRTWTYLEPRTFSSIIFCNGPRVILRH
jgi:hypothetical protein